MNATRAVAVLITMLTMAVSVRAYAETSSANGEEFFQLGRAALSEGKYELALSYFEQSYEADPALGTLLNLAVCEEKLGRLAEALLHLDAALKTVPTMDKRRPLIVERLAELERRTPRLTIRVHPPIGKGTIVVLDSRPLDPTDLGRTIRVDPGRHKLTCAGSSGDRCALEFTIVEGENSTKNLAISTSRPHAPSPVPAIENRRSPPERRTPVLAYGLGAFGIASIAAGLATGVVVIQKKQVVEEHCDADGCDPTGVDAADSGKTFSQIATVLTGLGVVAVGSSVYLMVTSPTSTQSAAAVSVVGEF
jgi:hypothetical protein